MSLPLALIHTPRLIDLRDAAGDRLYRARLEYADAMTEYTRLNHAVQRRHRDAMVRARTNGAALRGAS